MENGGRPGPPPPLGRSLPPSALVHIHVLLVEALQFILRPLARIAIALTDDPGELVELPLCRGQVIIGQLAPLFLHLAPELLPLPGDDVAIHLGLLSARRDGMLDDCPRPSSWLQLVSTHSIGAALAVWLCMISHRLDFACRKYFHFRNRE